MNTRKTPVNLTFGQLYDAVNNGEKFYSEGGEKIYVSSVTGLIETASLSCEGVYYDWIKSKIYQLKDWTEQLDNTWENGVWCMVWGDSKAFFDKVCVFDKDDPKMPYAIKFGLYFKHAQPLPEELAQQLEGLCDAG